MRQYNINKINTYKKVTSNPTKKPDTCTHHTCDKLGATSVSSNTQLLFTGGRPAPIHANTLAHNVLQNGPFQSAKWAVLGREMAHFRLRNGPNRKLKGYALT